MKKIFVCAFLTILSLCSARELDSDHPIFYIEYASGWTGSGLAKDINEKLHRLQSVAEQEKQYLRVKDIKITPEQGYAFILYEVAHREGETNPSRTYVEYASAWTGPGLTKDISAHLDKLQKTAAREEQYLQIKDIKITPKWGKITPEWGYAFIIYESECKSS